MNHKETNSKLNALNQKFLKWVVHLQYIYIIIKIILCAYKVALVSHL